MKIHPMKSLGHIDSLRASHHGFTPQDQFMCRETKKHFISLYKHMGSFCIDVHTKKTGEHKESGYRTSSQFHNAVKALDNLK